MRAHLNLFLLATVFAIPAHAAPATIRVSVATDGKQASGWSYRPSVSGDGRYVAFHSSAENLEPLDWNRYWDVFVRDTVGGITSRVSEAPAGVNGTQADDRSIDASLSADGRYVAFSSGATNLVSGDTNGVFDVFVRDLDSATTRRASLNSYGTQASGDGYGYGSSQPSISADGRYVAFESASSNLVSGDTNGEHDVFVRDRETGWTRRVSVATSGSQANDHSGKGYLGLEISDNGRYVAFASDASNLTAGDTNGAPDIFVRDLAEGTTTRVSVASDESPGNGSSYWPSISADGRYVCFDSSSSNLVPEDTNQTFDIFVRDLVTGITRRVSMASDGTQGNSYSESASISGDGRYVAFVSASSNLVPGDTNGRKDVFVRDLLSGTRRRVSVATDGNQGNSDSARPRLSADGRYVAFESYASNLVPNDTNGNWDIFLRGPLDGDVLAHNAIARFIVTPDTVKSAIEDLSFRVEPIAGVTLKSVRVAGSPDHFDGAPPATTLGKDGSVWTGTLNANCLRFARSNPVRFLATVIRSDDTVETAMASIHLIAPTAVDLRLAPGTLHPVSGQTVTIAASLTVPDAAGMANPCITVALPSDLTYVSDPGFQKAPDANVLIWTGPLPILPGLTAGQVVVPFRVRIPYSAPGKTYQISATAFTGRHTVSASTSLRISGPVAPRTVYVDESEGYGFLTGGLEWISDDQRIPLEARARPELKLSSWLFGDRRPDLWFGVHYAIAIGDSTVQPGPDLVGGLLARSQLMSPDVSPQYRMTFASLNGEVDILVGFTWRSMGLVLLEGLLKWYTSTPVDVARVVEVSDDFLAISSVYKAMKHFDPPPKTWAAKGQAIAAAVWDLSRMSQTEAQVVADIIKRATGKTVGIADVMAKTKDTLRKAEVLLQITDLVTIAIGSRCQPMEVRFVPAP